MRKSHLLLHGIALKKAADIAGIAAVTGLDPDEAEGLATDAVARGQVVESGGRYLLTPAAHMALQAEYPRYYSEQRSSAAMQDAYDAFEAHNRELKALISDWQTIEVAGDRIANDHSDKDYDTRIIDRLGDLHERFEPVLDRLAAEVGRLSIYKTLLLDALEKAEVGQHEWVSDAAIPSYHTVWFEMHEDLLRILGREREE